MNTDLPLDVTSSRDIPRRHHSKQLVATLVAWDSFLEKLDQSDANHFSDFPIESLNNIIAEASFLGFPQTVKLARAVRLAILRSTEHPTYSGANRRRLSRALETLKQSVTFSFYTMETETSSIRSSAVKPIYSGFPTGLPDGISLG